MTLPAESGSAGLIRLAGTARRRRELATFLRSRRERLNPAQVGLPTGGRRRTPGLRREEVAELAGVGVSWYTWLEQGRNIHPSLPVLEAIARTLQLSKLEREHLFTLAGAAAAPESAATYQVSRAKQQVLDQLTPFPACIQNARLDLLAYNQPYRFMLADLAEIPPAERNVLWLLFTNPHWRARMPDWAAAARLSTASFRAQMAGHLGEEAWTGLVTRLRAASPEFAEIWDRHDLAHGVNRTKYFDNPLVGRLELDHTQLWLEPRLGARLLVYPPATADTAARLEALATAIADRDAVMPD